MKKIRATILLLLFALTLNAQQYQITANLSGFPEQTKFYLKDLAIDLDVDSAVLINGKLIMLGKISSVKNFWLYTNAEGKFSYTNLLIGADQVLVKGDKLEFPRALSITGSSSQDVANKLNILTNSLWKSRDSVVNILMPLAMGELQNDSIKKLRKPLSKLLKQLDSIIEEINIKFIDENLNSYAALKELYYVRDKYELPVFKQLFANVSSPYKEGNYGTRISNYIRIGNPLKVGNDFYDFEAPDLKGQKFRVSSYKGKYILIDFTETYCGPCILAAENLKKIAKQHQSKLQIITFYAETNKKIMQQGITRDKFTWPTIWDGKGTYSDVTLKYGVDGYPTFILINPEGKIVSRVNGFGKDKNGKGNIENEVNRILYQDK